MAPRHTTPRYRKRNNLQPCGSGNAVTHRRAPDKQLSGKDRGRKVSMSLPRSWGILCPDPARPESRSGKPEVCRSKPAACHSIRTAALFCGAPRSVGLYINLSTRRSKDDSAVRLAREAFNQLQAAFEASGGLGLPALPALPATLAAVGQRRLRRSGSPKLSYSVTRARTRAMCCSQVPKAALHVLAKAGPQSLQT